MLIYMFKMMEFRNFSKWWKTENKDSEKEWAYLPKRKWCKLIVIQTGINKTLLYQ